MGWGRGCTPHTGGLETAWLRLGNKRDGIGWRMRDAEELWGRPRGSRENEGESRERENVGELLKSWRQYLGELRRHNLECVFPWCCWEGKGGTLTFIERLLCKESLSQVLTDVIIITATL